MSFFPSLPPPPPPPPFYTTADGGMSSTTQPLDTYNGGFIGDTSSLSSSSSSSSYASTSVTSSIVIISIVISSAIIISASIYILLRFLSRRSHRRYASADDVVLHNTITTTSGDSHYRALDSLPVFTFGSVNGNLTGGDCAVCLSKFEKEDQLRLLPLCCHAFHTHCIDAWLSTNQTCPLCRSTVYPTDTDVINKLLSVTQNVNNNSVNDNTDNTSSNGSSFRVEIGSISRRRGVSDSDGVGRRSYSVGSFEYIVEDGYEIPMDSISINRTGSSVDKESIEAAPPGERLEAEVGRNWLREYVDRLGSMSSRAISFRSSGRFFSGSSRRSDVVVPVDEDLEAINNRAGEDITELFRWISGV